MRMKMVKTLVVALVAFSLLLCFFSGCSSSEKDEAVGEVQYTTTAAATSGKHAGVDSPAENAEYGRAESTDDGTWDVDSDSVSGSSVSAYNEILADRKVIYNANLTVEVDYFDESYGKIQSIISAHGYVQSSSISSDRYYDKDGNEKVRKRGVIVIRVAREKFDSIFNSIKALGNILGEEIYTDDVTDKYFDIESRLKVLKIEEEKLISYLMDVKDPETIFKYEKRLTEIRQEVESYTGTLRKWDNLVQLSTITINLREVKEDNDAGAASKGYWRTLSDKFTSSVKGTVEFLGDLFIFLVQALPVLVVLGAIFIVFFSLIRFLKNRSGRTEKYHKQNAGSQAEKVEQQKQKE